MTMETVDTTATMYETLMRIEQRLDAIEQSQARVEYNVAQAFEQIVPLVERIRERGIMSALMGGIK